MATSNATAERDDAFQDLKARIKLIYEADPSQFISDHGIHRYLRAFKTPDAAFKAILKTNNWRKEFGVEAITAQDPAVMTHIQRKAATICRHRDMHGRPVIYIPVRNHNTSGRKMEDLTKYIIYVLEESCKRCHEEIIDNLCIVFDLKDFGLQCMDYQCIKTFIWVLGRHYPERLGVCIVYNAPTLFSTCWLIIRPWLTEVTANKVVFVSNETELCRHLHPEILPLDD